MVKILIAEDNDLNLKLMFDLLSTKNYDIDTAANGEIALSKLKSNKYDLLLLDLQMPKLSGFEVLRAIKENNIEVKTIVVSACAMEEEVDRAKKLGCVDFITKPIRINEFLDSIKSFTY